MFFWFPVWWLGFSVWFRPLRELNLPPVSLASNSYPFSLLQNPNFASCPYAGHCFHFLDSIWCWRWKNQWWAPRKSLNLTPIRCRCVSRSRFVYLFRHLIRTGSFSISRISCRELTLASLFVYITTLPASELCYLLKKFMLTLQITVQFNCISVFRAPQSWDFYLTRFYGSTVLIFLLSGCILFILVG